MKIEIICPLYNAEQYLVKLHKSLIKQENVEIEKIHYILTEGKDNSEQILKENGLFFDKITKEEFSHSCVRENAAMASKSDILVFISQDIIIEDTHWLEKLVAPIMKNEAEACYSRQISKFNNIEKYTREKNYSEVPHVMEKKDIDRFGLKAFFFSDSASAIKREIFVKLNGYDGKNLPTNEDMYIAYKLLTNSYRIQYCADSIVFHSHDFSLRETYDRYYKYGQFFKQNKQFLNYKENEAGIGLAVYILKRAIKERNGKVLLSFFPDMIARFVGMKMGKSSGEKI